MVDRESNRHSATNGSADLPRAVTVPAHTRAVRILAIAVALLALSVFATWPLVLHFNQMIFSQDPMLYTWNLWWVEQSITHLRNPWWSSDLFAPNGTYLSYQALVPIAGLVMAPVTALFGPVVAYNTLQLLLPPVGAVTARLAAGAMGLHAPAAWICGLLYGYATILVCRAEYHINFGAGLALLPIVLYFLARLRAHHRRRDAIGVGVGAAAVLYADQTIALVALLLSATYVAVAFVAESERRRWFGGIAVMVVTGLVLSAPQLLMMLRASAIDGFETNMPSIARTWVDYSASLRAMLGPGNVRPFVPGQLETWASSSPHGEAAPAFGWGMLALALAGLVLGLVRRARRVGGTRPLQRGTAGWAWAMWLLSLLLSMGPVVRWSQREWVPLPLQRYGQQQSALMPYTWLTFVRAAADLRVPGRFVFIGLLPIALLAGAGAQLLLSRRTSRHGRTGWLGAGACVLAIALVLALFETGYPDGPGTPPGWVAGRMPSFYAPVVADHSNSLVVDVPLSVAGGTSGAGFARAEESMLRATEHGHPVAGGYVARLGVRTFTMQLKHQLFVDLIQMQGVQPPAVPVSQYDPLAARRDAVAMNARWLVIWPEANGRILPFLRRVGYEPVGRSSAGAQLYRLRG